MPVERHRRLHAQRVPGSEPRRLDRGGGAADVGQHELDCLLGEGRRHDHLDAVLAGVARPRDDDPRPQEVLDHEAIALEAGQLRDQPGQEIDDLRALHGEHAAFGRLVHEVEFQIAAHLLEVIEQLAAVGRIADQEVLLVAHPADNGVVPAPPLLVEHERVTALAHGHPQDPAGADAIQEPLGVGTVDAEPSHVRDVEHAPACADLAMLIDDGAVEDGHRPARELHHLGALLDVEVVEGGSVQRRGRHDRHRSQESAEP